MFRLIVLEEKTYRFDLSIHIFQANLPSSLLNNDYNEDDEDKDDTEVVSQTVEGEVGIKVIFSNATIRKNSL